MNPLLPKDVQTRPRYLERVRPFQNQNIVKVFTGQRRVGKSYLLYQLIQELQQEHLVSEVIYINKEDLDFSFIKTARDLSNYVLKNKSSKGKTAVFIDEIQEIEDFEKALRSLLLKKELDLYCTGSNADFLSGDIAGHLSGRYIEIPVYSLSYTEFLDFQHLKEEQDSLEKYLKYGGLPYLKHLPLEDAVVFEYLKNIYNTIVYRDVINRYSIRNTKFLEQLVLFLAAHIGSIFSAKKISDFLKSQKLRISPNQVQIYIRYLCNAFLIQPVRRYDLIGKRIFEFGEKYYFENLGIRNGLYGYRPDDRAKILENAVFNHLLFSGYEVKVGAVENKEVDFVAEKGGEKHYYQVALSLNDSKTWKREVGNLKDIKDNYPKTLITMEPFSGNSMDGIKITDIRSFLKSG